MCSERDIAAEGGIRIKGSYATKRNARGSYEYDGFCFPVDGRILWRARVYRDGQLIETLYGRLGPGSPTPDLLAAAIAAKIEELGT